MIQKISETDAQLYRRYAEKWEEFVHCIRGLPGFNHFLLLSPISTLRAAVAEGSGGDSSEFRCETCDAVIVPSQGDLVLVPLPDITAKELLMNARQLSMELQRLCGHARRRISLFMGFRMISRWPGIVIL